MLQYPDPVTPSELRSVFGQNLKLLSASFPSVSDMCRRLGINRTQYNRYLTGESFPRPEILQRICSFFDVDARILLSPLAGLERASGSILSHAYIADWLGARATHVPEDMFPSGFFRFSRRSFLDDSRFLQGLVLVRRMDGHTFLRGLEPREAMRQQGLPVTSAQRDFRGIVLQQDEGVSILTSRRGGKTGGYSFLSPVASYENNYWDGFVTRTIRSQPSGQRMTRMVYEYLGHDTGTVLNAARSIGYCDRNDLPAHHLRVLQVDKPLD